MKKTAIALVASAAAMFAASCQKETSPIQEEFVPMTISAVAEGLNTPVKSAIEFKYDVTWTANDKIYVTDGNDKNDTFTIISESVGKTLGKFTQDGQTAFVSQETPSCDVKAYYPSSMMDGTTPTWPASQTYSPENAQTVPMYSKKTITATGDQTFSFGSLGSVLQIVFNTTQPNVTLKSIEIKDGSKTMSGEFHVDENGMAIIAATDKAGITLDLGTGKALGKGANYFNIAVPTNNYTDLTLVFTATDDSKCTLEHGSVNIAYNTVGRLTLTGEKFKADVPEDALSGIFTVSDSDGNPNNGNETKVSFSKGNLQATYSTSTSKYTWGFAANQYSYIGNAAGNTSIDSQTDGAVVDLFGWVGASSSFTGDAQYGVSTSKTASDYGNVASEALKSDWGNTIDNSGTWRTLTKDEWEWLLGPSSSPNPGTNCRTSSEVNGTANARYLKCKVAGVSGLMIFPDTFTWPSGAGYAPSSGINTATLAWTSVPSYTADQFEALEGAGVVFLPAVGYRNGTKVENVGNSGIYWSSTASSSTNAYNLDFYGGTVSPTTSYDRYCGRSVRLVSVVQ